jgi:hypothetical protein
MKTIQLTDNQYKDLLWFKNFMTTKLRVITNQEVIKVIDDYHLNKGKTEGEFKRIPKGTDSKMDYEPEYTFGHCIHDIIESVMIEQQTGEVNYIT